MHPALRVVKDFPKAGVNFVDIWPLFRDPLAVEQLVTRCCQHLSDQLVHSIVGLESRGFPLGVLIAARLRLPFVPIRKPSKLPGDVIRTSGSTEYSTVELELQRDALKPGDRVVLVDDVLATGGTLLTASDLVGQLGASVCSAICVADCGLGGVERLAQHKISVFFCGHEAVTTSVFTEEAPKKNQYLVMCHPSMEATAALLGYERAKVRWSRFPDGNPDLEFDSNVANRRVVFLASMRALPQDDDKRFFEEQLSMIAILPRHSIMSLDVLIPYFAVGTMERVERPGVVATAETFANIIASSCTALTRTGPPNVAIIDLHNPVSRFNFNDRVRLQPLSMFPEMLRELDMLTWEEDDAKTRPPQYGVVFPDEGSYKRFRELVPSHVPMIECGKDRATRDVKVSRVFNYTGDLALIPRLVIADDLVHSGGTLLGCVKAIRALSPKCRVSIYCTHAVFENHEYNKFLDLGLEHFWISDSVPERARLLADVKPFRVLPVALLYAKHLRQFSGEPPQELLLCSNSPVKFAALCALADAVYGARHSICRKIQNAKSDVPEQPVGFEETERGAKSRLYSRIRSSGILIAIESGVRYATNGDFEDFAVITDGVRMSTTVPTPIDPDIATHFFQVDPGTTVGKIYMRHKGARSADNWHYSITGVSRAYLLYRGLMDLWMN